jgi:hypothetical protein
MSLKGTKKEKWTFISGLSMIIIVFISKGFLLFPIALTMIVTSLYRWTKDQREIEAGMGMD